MNRNNLHSHRQSTAVFSLKQWGVLASSLVLLLGPLPVALAQSEAPPVMGAVQVEAPVQESASPFVAMPLDFSVKSQEMSAKQSDGEPTLSDSQDVKNGSADNKAAKANKRRLKRDSRQNLPDTLLLPSLTEIQNLKWEVAPIQTNGSPSDTKRIGLEKVFQTTLAHSTLVRQAEARVKDAESQAKEIRDPVLFNLINPVDTASLKKAAAADIQAANAQLQAAQQKALLESASLYVNLTQAFLAKYLAYQTIEQGRRQLSAEQRRFQSGETTSFDVTQTQMALIERYSKYLTADNTYRSISMALSNQLGLSTEETWVPDDFVWQEGEAIIPALKLIPEDLSLAKARKMTQTRPDIRAMGFKKDALDYLVKASAGLEKQKKKAELRQLELEIEKSVRGVEILAEQAFNAYHLADKNAKLARQQVELSSRFVRQLRVSRDAGFSSAKDVLDGEGELARTRTALISAQLSCNLSQIQLLYELGLLREDILSHPPSLSPNTL